VKSTNLSTWDPLPAGENQFPLEYMKQQGILILKNNENQIVLGLTEDKLLTRLQLENYFHGREVVFFSLDRREFSIFLANRFSVNCEGGKIGKGRDVNIEKLEGDAPVINLVNSLIMEALKEGASDIHIEAFPTVVPVRFRIDGMLKQARTIPREHFEALSSRIKIMANLNIMERRLPQDGRISVRTGGESVDMRVSVVPIAGMGESIALRLLNRSGGIKSLEEMGFLPDQLKLIRRLSAHPHGLILITGPTGSGKTTTLNGILREINSPSKKIITIEDPIEFLIDGIDQIQTNTEIGLTFSILLRRVLRQDPNIIMVGEIRDGETAELAVRAALTGHLVLSTLHTNDSLSTPVRLNNMGVKPFLLAAVLKGVMAQRLVRRLCPHCRRERVLEPGERTLWLGLNIKPPEKLWEPAGCDLCGGEGYRGRTVLAELFQTGPETQELISRERGSKELEGLLLSRGWKTLLNNSLDRVVRGETTLSEVKEAVYLP
jgi:general secretion pathway protein E